MIKYIIKSFLFTSFSVIAMNSDGEAPSPATKSHDITLKIRDQQLTCKALHNTNLSLCAKNNQLSGLVLWSDNFTAPFWPILFDRADFIVDLSIDIIYSTTHGLAANYTFKWYDFVSLSRSALMVDISQALGVCSANELQQLSKYIRLISTSMQSIDTLKGDIRSHNRQQEFKCNNDIIRSRIITKECLDNQNSSAINPTALASLSENARSLFKLLQFTKHTKALSMQEAQETFERVLKMDDIPFAYHKDGCYARAHVVCARLESANYHMGKIWVKAQLKDPREPCTRWGYHVAPMIVVAIEEVEEVRIIDPTLSKEKLLTVDEWLVLLNLEDIQSRKIVDYPLPENGNEFENILICHSSPLPLFPYAISLNDTAAITLEKAEKEVEKYQKKLLFTRPNNFNF